MTDNRDYQINARISTQAGARLKLLAKNRRESFGEIIDRLIMDTPLSAVDWQMAIDDLNEKWEARITALESQLNTEPLSDYTPIVDSNLDLPPINIAIAELKAAGFKPQAVADELNSRGYRTRKGTPIQRGYVNNIMKRV